MQTNGGFAQFGWARLVSKFSPEIFIVQLKEDESLYGKNMIYKEGFVFTAENCKPELFKCISGLHFKIHREATPHEINLRPALVTATGRNGLVINDVPLAQYQSKILKSGDFIKLTISSPLFQFIDDRTFNTLNVPRRICNEYHLDSFFGKGGQSTVRLVYNFETGQKFAMKQIPKGKFGEESEPKRLKRLDHIKDEVKSMRIMNHVNVIKLMSAFENQSCMCLILELAEYGDLLKYIQSYQYRFLPEPEAKFCLFQIAKGLHHVHSFFVAHRDIKVENIFVMQQRGGQMVMKIGDFGYSKTAEHLTTQLGTRCFYPPEIQDRDGEYTLSADIWTLGCLFYSCLVGAFPFHAAYGDTLSQQIRTASLDFERHPQWRNVSFCNSRRQISLKNFSSIRFPATSKFSSITWSRRRQIFDHRCSKFCKILGSLTSRC